MSFQILYMSENTWPTLYVHYFVEKIVLQYMYKATFVSFMPMSQFRCNHFKNKTNNNRRTNCPRLTWQVVFGVPLRSELNFHNVTGGKVSEENEKE